VPGVVEPLFTGKSWNVHIPYPIHNVEKFSCRTEVRYARRFGLTELRNLRLNPSAECHGGNLLDGSFVCQDCTGTPAIRCLTLFPALPYHPAP
jgi:hypothetical protein